MVGGRNHNFMINTVHRHNPPPCCQMPQNKGVYGESGKPPKFECKDFHQAKNFRRFVAKLPQNKGIYGEEGVWLRISLVGAKNHLNTSLHSLEVLHFPLLTWYPTPTNTTHPRITLSLLHPDTYPKSPPPTPVRVFYGIQGVIPIPVVDVPPMSLRLSLGCVNWSRDMTHAMLRVGWFTINGLGSDWTD